MNEFKRYHPIVNFIYFLFVIGFSMFSQNPVCLAISIICSVTYLCMLRGGGALKKSILIMLPFCIMTALLNAAFNHEGVTVLAYLPSGNPLTLESILFGFLASGMIVAVICWFSCYNAVMTSDKFIYLFGRIIPSFSLVLSMTLRFVPRFWKKLREVVNAQKCIGKSVNGAKVKDRIKSGLAILSVMATWALENSVETADSMKSRGYGLSGRTAYSNFTFGKHDIIALLSICVFGIYVLVGRVLGAGKFSCFPTISIIKISPLNISVFFSYLLLCIIPIIIEILEVRKWKAIKLKT